MSFETFQFREMLPSEDLKIFANRCLERLRENAPYLSTFVASLEYDSKQDSGKYTCTIELFSHWGHFVAKSSAYYPEAAIVWSEHKINSKLWSWKEKRFMQLDEKMMSLSGGLRRENENKKQNGEEL